HGVGVLLQFATVPEVAQQWLVTAADLQGAVELCQRDDGNIQIPREPLEPPADCADLLVPGDMPVLGVDQLQVVDEDAAQPVPLSPSRGRRYSQNRLPRRVVDEGQEGR